MKAGIGAPDKSGNPYIVNISSINTHNLCDRKWFHERVENRVSPSVGAHYLQTGTVGHAAIEDLHSTHGEWRTDAALAIAQKHANALRAEAERTANLMEQRDYENVLWFCDWLPRAFALYAAKYREAPWQALVAVEEEIWLEVYPEDLDHPIAPYDRILLVQRPDALVVRNDRIWHVQRKFFSARTDVIGFLNSGPTQKHEVTYLTTVQQLFEQGDLEFPAGHTLFDIVVKMEIPEHPSTMVEPKICECVELDETERLKLHPRMSADRWAEHVATEKQKLVNFEEAKAKRQHAYDTFTARAFVQDDCRIRKQQRARVFGELLYDVGQMIQKSEGLTRTTPKQGWACTAYGRKCPYLGICAGRETITGPQFIDRPTDYTDREEE